MDFGARRAGHKAHLRRFHIGERYQPGAGHLGVPLGGLGEPGAAEEHIDQGLALADFGHALAAGHQIRGRVAPDWACAQRPTLTRSAFFDAGSPHDRSVVAIRRPPPAGIHATLLPLFPVQLSWGVFTPLQLWSPISSCHPGSPVLCKAISIVNQIIGLLLLRLG